MLIRAYLLTACIACVQELRSRALGRNDKSHRRTIAQAESTVSSQHSKCLTARVFGAVLMIMALLAGFLMLALVGLSQLLLMMIEYEEGQAIFELWDDGHAHL